MENPQVAFAHRAAAKFAQKAEKYGSEIVVGGQSCKAFSKAMPRGDDALLAFGANSNSAFPDIRIYMFAPGALANPPLPQMTVLDAGKAYIIMAVPPPERVASVSVYESFYAYLSPPGDAETVQGPTEADPGRRVNYRPKSASE